LTLSELEERWITAPRAVREWLALFASPLIRNRATLGGNLATASPVGDSAPLLLALSADVRVAGCGAANAGRSRLSGGARDAAGIGGDRSIALRDFFTGYRQTALRPGELIAGITIPKPLPRYLAFYKAAKRTLDDISTVAAAIALDIDSAGCITRAQAAYGGVAATPVLVDEFRQALVGRAWSLQAVRAAQHAVGAAITPLSDHRGSARYRAALAQSLIEKFWHSTREARAA